MYACWQTLALCAHAHMQDCKVCKMQTNRCSDIFGCNTFKDTTKQRLKYKSLPAMPVVMLTGSDRLLHFFLEIWHWVVRGISNTDSSEH